MLSTSPEGVSNTQQQKLPFTVEATAPPSKPKRIRDVFAGLYEDEPTDKEHAKLQPSDAPSPAATSSTASSANSSSPTAPSQKRIDEVVKKLHDSIKVVAVTDCPVHPARPFCDCPAGMTSLGPSDIAHCKINIFMRYWDIKLLGGCEYAFDYAGNQASHDTFVAKEGKTPRQFAKAFLQQTSLSEVFVPNGKMNEMIQAMVDYWVVRNAQWKAKYGTRENADEKWLWDTYDMSDTKKIPNTDLNRDVQPGDTLSTFECQYGLPGHECMLVLMPHGDLAGGFAMQVLEMKRCHERCPVMDPLEQEAVKAAVDRCARQSGHNVDVSKLQTFDSADALKEYAKKQGGSG